MREKRSITMGCFDICKITNPDNIRSLLVKILLEMIGEFAVFIVFVRMKRLLGRIEEAVHSCNTDVNAIITLKNICFKPFVLVGIDVKNLGSNHLIFLVLSAGAEFYSRYCG